MQISGNGNVFTFRFSDAQFKKLDKNNDGVLSQDELKNSGLFNFDNNTEWLTNTAASERTTETTQTEGTNGTTNTQPTVPTTSSEVPETANTQVELRTYFTKLKDNFIQDYIKGQLESGELEESDRKNLITYLNQNARTYIEGYIKENSKGPYDINAIFSDFETYINGKLEERKQLETEVTEKLNNYKQNTDVTFDELLDMVNKADEEYITGEEYEQIKDKATDFIIGQMLNGNESTTFFSKLDANYKNNIEYRKVVAVIEQLKTETDPVKINNLINSAEKSINTMIGEQRDDGTSTVYDGVKALQVERNNEKYSDQLDALVDSMMESYSQGSVSEKDIDTHKTLLTNIQTAFLSQYTGNGENIEEEFKAFVEQVEADYQEVAAKTDSPYNMDSLDSAIQNAGSYVSTDEKEDINTILSSLIVNNAAEGSLDSFLNNISEGLTSDSNYKEAQTLLAGLATSATPKEDYEKAVALIEDLVKNVSAEDIEKAIEIEKTKTVSLSTDSTMTAYLWGYKSNDTLGGDDDVYTNFTIKDGKVEWTNGDDKADLNKTFTQLNERIHSKLQEQLGELYNKDEIEKYYNEAMVEMAMNINNPSGLHNVDELVNSFLTKFDKIATAGLKGETPAADKTSLNKTDVLSAANAYGDYTSGVQSGSWHRKKKNTAKGEAENLANTYLNKLTPALLSQYKVMLGDQFDETAITKMINEVIYNMVHNDSTYIDTNSHHNGYKWGFDVKTLYDTLFNNLDATFQNYLKQTGITL